MKRAITILLLIVFAYSYLGAGFFYNSWLYSIKEQVKEKLESGFPEEIKIPKSWEDNPPQEFKWHEEHEFRYHGQMYDVIRKEIRGDQIGYYCYWDKAERDLLNNLKYISNYLTQQPDQQEKADYLKLVLQKTFLLLSLKQNLISF